MIVGFASIPIRSEAKDLAKELGENGVRQLLKIMCDAYHDLRKSNFVAHNKQEPEITEEWYLKILKQWRNSNMVGFYPICEKGDRRKGMKRGKAPTIDFCFRDEYYSASYFGAECKLLDEGEEKYVEYYVDKGIMRYLEGKYGRNTSAGSMIGYVRTGDAKNVANKVAAKVQTLPGAPKMMRSRPLDTFDNLHESSHKRILGVTPFQLYHLFFQF